MIVSLEEAVTVPDKWKDDSTRVFILGQGSFRGGLWAIHEDGVDWNMALRAKFAQVSVSEGTYSTKRGVVLFEAEGGGVVPGNGCVCIYPCPKLRHAGICTKGMRGQSCPSCLFIVLSSNETFVIHELGGPES